jgi:hypothetical protein
MDEPHPWPHTTVRLPVWQPRTSVAVVGMTFGFLAARLLLERWQGVQSQDHALFAFDRLR